MPKVLIIEDEALAAQKLIRQLKNIDADLEIIETIDSVSEAVAFLSEKEVDLIFLDIHLGDDVSFKIFEKIKIKTPVIFTTAYDEYAIKAFKLNSLDYLLKPVNKNDLRDAIEKFYEQRNIQYDFDYRGLLLTLKNSQNSFYHKRFMVQAGEVVKSIPIDQIAYFFAEGKYVFLVTSSNQEFLIDYTLDKLSEVLDPDFFFRINRQYFIHIEAISEMIVYSKGRLKIELNINCKKEMIVSIERAMMFKKWLNK